MTVTLHEGDSLAVLRTLESESVQCVVTSPPYYGLRAYGTNPQVWGGDPEHGRHEWGPTPGRIVRDQKRDTTNPSAGRWLGTRGEQPAKQGMSADMGAFCPCGSWRGELGSEPTPALFIEHLLTIFDEVKRVLRSDGLCFVNLGDSMSGSGRGPTGIGGIQNSEKRQGFTGKSSVKSAILREDLTPVEVEHVVLELRRSLPELWSSSGEEEREGAMPDMLCPSVQGRQSGSDARTTANVLPAPSDDLQCKDHGEKTGDASEDDRGFGRDVCVLQGDGVDVSLSRSHQGGREEGIPERDRPASGMAASSPGGITSGQVSSALLELQCSAGPLRFVPALQLDFADVPKQIRQYFRIKEHRSQGIPAKNLLLLPERFAIGMQDRGWTVRSRIAWCKTSAMPESVRDRPTSAWEHIWMFSKSARYFYDADAVRQPLTGGAVYSGPPSPVKAARAGMTTNGTGASSLRLPSAGANLRNWWALGPEPNSDAHYASFPTAIPRRCILAGTSERGACSACGSPWRRVVERTRYEPEVVPAGVRNVDASRGDKVRKLSGAEYNANVKTLSERWQPSCQCPPAEPVPQTVLDPFLGSGTTALVADRLGRHAIGIELNPTYAEMARRRLDSDAPLWSDPVEVVPAEQQAGLWESAG